MLQVSAWESCCSRWILIIAVSPLESCCCHTRVKGHDEAGGVSHKIEKKKNHENTKIPHPIHPSNLTSEHGLASRRKLQSSNCVVVYAAFLIFFRHLLFHIQEFGVRRWGLMIHDYYSYNPGPNQEPHSWVLRWVG